MRALHAVVDTHSQKLHSPYLNESISLELTNRGLFLADVNELVMVSTKCSAKAVQQDTFMTEDVQNSCQPVQESGHVAESHEKSLVDSSMRQVLGSSHNHQESCVHQKLGAEAVQPAIKDQALEATQSLTNSRTLSDHGRLGAALEETSGRGPCGGGGLSKFSLLQFQEMKIDFGTANKGRTYLDVWKNNQTWVKWFLEHFGQSKKPSHRRVVHYFALEIELCELTNQAIPLTVANDASKAAPKTPAVVVKPKAKARLPPVSDLTSEEFQMIDELSEEYAMDPDDLKELHALQELENPELVLLNQRMNQMEGMLQQIVQHLQQDAAQASKAT